MSSDIQHAKDHQTQMHIHIRNRNSKCQLDLGLKIFYQYGNYSATDEASYWLQCILCIEILTFVKSYIKVVVYCVKGLLWTFFGVHASIILLFVDDMYKSKYNNIEAFSQHIPINSKISP